jgi:ketosteroid isomerase-like protein
MSQENADVVVGYFEAANRGDFRAAMAAYTDDVVLVIDDRAIPTGAGTFSGREAVGEWLADWFRSFARGYRFEVEETRSVGAHVVAVARHDGHGRSSGVAIDWTLGYAFTITEGKISRLELYQGRAEAFEAVGLEEESGSR